MPRFARRRLARNRSSRPHVQWLEDRTNPAGISFVPFSAAAVNPAPLPATALMQFNPLPDVTGLPATATTITIPVHVAGSFHQVLTPPIISMGTGPAIGFPAKL